MPPRAPPLYPPANLVTGLQYFCTSASVDTHTHTHTTHTHKRARAHAHTYTRHIHLTDLIFKNCVSYRMKITGERIKASRTYVTKCCHIHEHASVRPAPRVPAQWQRAASVRASVAICPSMQCVNIYIYICIYKILNIWLTGFTSTGIDFHLFLSTDTVLNVQ